MKTKTEEKKEKKTPKINKTKSERNFVIAADAMLYTELIEMKILYMKKQQVTQSNNKA
jgi:hypothetical protein